MAVSVDGANALISCNSDGFGVGAVLEPLLDHYQAPASVVSNGTMIRIHPRSIELTEVKSTGLACVDREIRLD